MREAFAGRWQIAFETSPMRHVPAVLLGAAFLWAGLLKAARTPLWFDEIVTYHVASLDGPRAIIEALLARMDNHPPLDYLARHLSMSLFGASELALRLPSVIALLVGACALYLFVLRRTSVLAALVAFSFPFVTMAVRYAYDARAYAFLFASMCLTLLAWQLATEKRSLPRYLFLTLCLGLGPHSHFYGILNYVPIAVGEAWRWRERGGIDWPIVACFGVSALLVGLLIPFAIHSSDFAGHFWTSFGPGLVAFIYDDVLGKTLPAAVAALAACAVIVFFFPREPNPGLIKPEVPRHEVAAAIMLCLVPVTTYILAELVTRAYTDKYLINTIAGVALVVAYLTGAAGAWRRGCALAIALSFTLWTAGTLAYMARYTPARAYAVPAEDLQRVAEAKQPVVVFDAHDFLKMHYYLPPHLRDRIYHLADAGLSVKYAGHDTNDIVFENLKPFVRLNVPTLCAFTQQHRRFLIFLVRPSWVVPKLLEDGAEVRLVGVNAKGYSWLSVTLDAPSGC